MALLTKTYSARQIWESPADIYIGLPAPPSNVPALNSDIISLDSQGQPSTLAATVLGGAPTQSGIFTISAVAGNVITVNALAGTPFDLSVSDATGFAFQQVVTLTADGNGGGTLAIGFHAGLTDGPASFHLNQKFSEIRADQFEHPIDYAFISTDFEVDCVFKEVDFQRMNAWMSCPPLTTASKLANSNVMQYGGVDSDAQSFFSIMLVGVNRRDTTKFAYMFGYKAYLKSSFQLTFHRATTNAFKVKLALVADTDRAVGDEFCAICKHTDPTP